MKREGCNYGRQSNEVLQCSLSQATVLLPLFPSCGMVILCTCLHESGLDSYIHNSIFTHAKQLHNKREKRRPVEAQRPVIVLVLVSIFVVLPFSACKSTVMNVNQLSCIPVLSWFLRADCDS